MPTVSALILTKNSERTIDKCLTALKPAVDQIIVVDTGSTDHTLDIAKSHGADLYHFAWCDDFSAARNFALSKATTDWVISLDSDEILFAEDTPKIRQYAALYDDQPNAVLVIQTIQHTGDSVPQFRMFHNQGRIKWFRPIHEQVVFDGAFNLATYRTDIRVFHDGYDENVVDLQAKYLRNIALLEKAKADTPDDPVYEFYLGREKMNANFPWQDVAMHLTHALQLAPQHPEFTEFIPNTYSLLVNAMLRLGQIGEAERLTHTMMTSFPNYPDSLYWQATISLMRAGSVVEQAYKYMSQAKQMAAAYQGSGPFDANIATWKADLGIADMMRFSGNLVEARKLYATVSQYSPEARQRIQDIDAQADMLQRLKGQ